MCIICLGRTEEGLEGEVARDDKAGNVCQELATEVENDEEEVEASKTHDGIGLGDGGAPLEVNEDGVLGELEELRARISIQLSCAWVGVGNPIPLGRAVRYSAEHGPEGKTSWRWCRDVILEELCVRRILQGSQDRSLVAGSSEGLCCVWSSSRNGGLEVEIELISYFAV